MNRVLRETHTPSRKMSALGEFIGHVGDRGGNAHRVAPRWTMSRADPAGRASTAPPIASGQQRGPVDIPSATGVKPKMEAAGVKRLVVRQCPNGVLGDCDKCKRSPSARRGHGDYSDHVTAPVYP